MSGDPSINETILRRCVQMNIPAGYSSPGIDHHQGEIRALEHPRGHLNGSSL